VGGACRKYEGEEKCLHGFGVKAEGKRQPGRTQNMWDDNIKNDFEELGWKTWSEVTLSVSIKFEEFLLQLRNF
jgi:hypothetical protein